MTYYLAGPMTGIPDYNFPAFAHAAHHLRMHNFVIISPHETQHVEPIPGQIGNLPYVDYLRGDFRHFLDCTGLILLPGWPASTGARAELELALTLKMPIFFYRPDGRVISMQDGGYLL